MSTEQVGCHGSLEADVVDAGEADMDSQAVFVTDTNEGRPTEITESRKALKSGGRAG